MPTATALFVPELYFLSPRELACLPVSQEIWAQMVLGCRGRGERLYVT